MTVYFVYGINVLSQDLKHAPIYGQYLAAGMKHAGAFVMEEREFILHAHRDKLVRPTDKVVCFFCSDENAHLVYGAVDPQNRWTYIIDERAQPDGSDAYGSRIREHFPRFGVTHAVITYSSQRHMGQLDNAGIKHVTMPVCVPSRRRRTLKPRNVIATGTLEAKTYPTRARLISAFERLANDMQERVTAPPGAPYYDALDGFNFGIVCRVGETDRLIAKYAEFGMCHVLPVGDCPTYMPGEMKQAMVNVVGMTNDQIVAEVKRLLASPDELRARQDAYCELTHQHFDLRENAERVMREILAS